MDAQKSRTRVTTDFSLPFSQRMNRLDLRSVCPLICRFTPLSFKSWPRPISDGGMTTRLGSVALWCAVSIFFQVDSVGPSTVAIKLATSTV